MHIAPAPAQWCTARLWAALQPALPTYMMMPPHAYWLSVTPGNLSGGCSVCVRISEYNSLRRKLIAVQASKDLGRFVKRLVRRWRSLKTMNRTAFAVIAALCLSGEHGASYLCIMLFHTSSSSLCSTPPRQPLTASVVWRRGHAAHPPALIPLPPLHTHSCRCQLCRGPGQGFERRGRGRREPR